jgi:integrase/recombinase XerC
MSVSNYIHLFENYLTAEKRHSNHTVIAYVKDVKDFLEFSDVTTEDEVKEINSGMVRAWIVDLKTNTLSNRSIQRKLTSTRVFFKWLQETDGLLINPSAKIKGPKTAKRLPVFVKQEQIDYDQVAQLFSDDFSGSRDRLIFEILYQTGIRLSELIHLKHSNVSSSTIKVLGKRNKERIIPIGLSLYTMILEYNQRKENLNFTSENVLVLDNGKNIYEKFVYRKINTYLGTITTLDKRSPHVMRHTFATHMLNNGAGLEVLKEILGHANLTATQVYTHNSFAEINKVYNQAHPRGSKLNQ